MPAAETSVMEKIVSLCKRRGFVYPASEIYGGLNGFWDYGPLGVLLKNNIRDSWWRNMVITPPIGPDGHPIEMLGIDSAIIQNPKTWVASGHVGGFNDPMMDDKETNRRYRADHVYVFPVYVQNSQKPIFCIALEASSATEAMERKREQKEDFLRKLLRESRKLGIDPSATSFNVGLAEWSKLSREDQVKTLGPADEAPESWIVASDLNDEQRAITFAPGVFDRPGTLMAARPFNLLFETYVGALQSEESKAYLRPETAQGIFLNFKNILDTTRVKVPFGVAQVGKSFRNEVTPRNFIFRSREFEQMEMEWFCHPDEAAKWYEFWKAERMRWWESIGVSGSNLRLREHEKEELSHYSKMTVDIEYKYPFTAPDFGELEGIAHRGCFDLTQHQQHSGQKMDYFDQELQLKLKEQGVSDEEVKARSRYIPNVIEPASGLTRAVLVLLCEGYTADESRPSKEYMKFTPEMAPIKAGIFPLVNKEGMPEIAEKLYLDLRTKWTCEFDAKQSIGKRYARMDEVGTPFCITIDGETLQNQTVTLRDRDTAQQQRIAIEKVRPFLAEKLRA